ncbi:DUF1800 domain-containing protein [Undibacterium sp. Ren11W]|uniref:DUF1800 domain-containing protein n=1 Tax=Undibacterium sp. Ren11W TaxID=3413045 RepID=UPI003BF1B8CB
MEQLPEINQDASLPLASLLTATALLSACGGGGSSIGGNNATAAGSPPPVTPPAVITKPANEAEAARFLAQAGFGGSAVARQALISNGYEPWINEQQALAQGQSRFDELNAIKLSDPASFALQSEQRDNLMWKRIAAAPDMLRQRMTLALSEIFVVNISGVDLPTQAHALCGYMDMLEKHAFGNFRQLLEDVTLSVPMGRMLGTFRNMKEDSKTGRRPDENYAREVMQLFTIGLVDLNMDGTAKLDANGKPIDSYNQDTVSNLARVFTGWSIILDWTSPDPDPEPMRQPMRLDENAHSLLEKKFLGATIAANTDGRASLKIALDTLFNHANVAPFISRQFIQRFVCSNPSAAYVGRVAAVFANNGLGVRGDLKAVVKSILIDSEARTAPDVSNLFAGKIVEPMVRVGSFFRGMKFTSPDGQWRLVRARSFGQQPLGAPSVFNFFRPGYVPPNTVLATQNKQSPELQIVSEQTVLTQVNEWASLLDNPASYTHRNYQDAAKAYKSDADSTGLQMDWTLELAMVSKPDTLIEHFNLLFSAGQLSANSKQIILSSVSKMPLTDTDPAKLRTKQLNLIKTVALMVLVAADTQLLK